MITLPPIEFACLKIFSMVIGVCAGACVTGFLALLGMPGPIIVGGMVALCIAVSGFLVPSFSRFLYRAWNRIAIEFAKCMGKIVMGICYYVILLAVGSTGSTISLKDQGDRKSMWLHRGMIAPDIDSKQHAMTTDDPLQPNWIPSFVSWAVKSGNFWRCSLIPFIILLASFDSSREETVPTDIYTLY